jgi:hypothetical protein
VRGLVIVVSEKEREGGGRKAFTRGVSGMGNFMEIRDQWMGVSLLAVLHWLGN